MQFGKSAIVLALAVLASGYNSASASSVSINLGSVIGPGSFPSGDSSSKPYLNATIVDGTNGGNSGVFLTMSTPGLGFAGSANYEHVMQWEFKVSTVPSLASITQTAKTDTNAGAPSPYFTDPVISNTGSFTDDPTTDSFNLQFKFAEGGGGSAPDGIIGGVEFGHGDSVTYFIKGLTSSSFVVGNPGSNYTAAFVDDANVWVAGSTATGGGNQAVPLPSSVSSGLAMLGGMGGMYLLRKRRVVMA
jgi:hypothetical protein